MYPWSYSRGLRNRKKTYANANVNANDIARPLCDSRATSTQNLCNWIDTGIPQICDGIHYHANETRRTDNVVGLQLDFSGLLRRDASIKRGLSRHAVSVRLCVCLSRSWIMSK